MCLDVAHRQLRQCRHRRVAGRCFHVQRLASAECRHLRCAAVGAAYGPSEGDACRECRLHILAVGCSLCRRQGGHQPLACGGATAEWREVYVVTCAAGQSDEGVTMGVCGTCGVHGNARARAVAGGKACVAVLYDHAVDAVPRAPRQRPCRRRRHLAYGAVGHRQVVHIHGAAARRGAQGDIAPVAAVARQVGHQVLPASECREVQGVHRREAVGRVGVGHHAHHYRVVVQQALVHAVEVEAHHRARHVGERRQADGGATGDAQAVAAAVAVAVGHAGSSAGAPVAGSVARDGVLEVVTVWGVVQRRPCVDAHRRGSAA